MYPSFALSLFLISVVSITGQTELLCALKNKWNENIFCVLSEAFYNIWAHPKSSHRNRRFSFFFFFFSTFVAFSLLWDLLMFPYYLFNSAGKKDKRDPSMLAKILLLFLQSILAHVVLILISIKNTKRRCFSSALLKDHVSHICSLPW